jgi:AraC-like DNA-binding protein
MTDTFGILFDTIFCFLRERQSYLLHNLALHKANTILDATHYKLKKIKELAERVGFEPTVEFPRHTLSKRAP